MAEWAHEIPEHLYSTLLPLEVPASRSGAAKRMGRSGVAAVFGVDAFRERRGQLRPS